jgi:hypothetical protein
VLGMRGDPGVAQRRLQVHLVRAGRSWVFASVAIVVAVRTPVGSLGTLVHSGSPVSWVDYSRQPMRIAA